MEPLYFYGHIFELDEHDLPKVATDFSPKVTPELARTEFFTNTLQSVIGNTYKIGYIKFQGRYKHPYSIYGRSQNDLYIMHKNNYTSAGVVNLKDNISEEEEEEEELEIGYETKGRTVEFKNSKTYAVQQTIKEMLRASGDLTAKVLIEGK